MRRFEACYDVGVEHTHNYKHGAHGGVSFSLKRVVSHEF